MTQTSPGTRSGSGEPTKLGSSFELDARELLDVELPRAAAPLCFDLHGYGLPSEVGRNDVVIGDASGEGSGDKTDAPKFGGHEEFADLFCKLCRQAGCHVRFSLVLAAGAEVFRSLRRGKRT